MWNFVWNCMCMLDLLKKYSIGVNKGQKVRRKRTRGQSNSNQKSGTRAWEWKWVGVWVYVSQCYQGFSLSALLTPLPLPLFPIFSLHLIFKVDFTYLPLILWFFLPHFISFRIRTNTDTTYQCVNNRIRFESAFWILELELTYSHH